MGVIAGGHHVWRYSGDLLRLLWPLLLLLLWLPPVVRLLRLRLSIAHHSLSLRWVLIVRSLSVRAHAIMKLVPVHQGGRHSVHPRLQRRPQPSLLPSANNEQEDEDNEHD